MSSKFKISGVKFNNLSNGAIEQVFGDDIKTQKDENTSFDDEADNKKQKSLDNSIFYQDELSFLEDSILKEELMSAKSLAPNLYNLNSDESNFNLPSDFRSVPANFFAEAINLKKIKLHNNCSEICENAFRNCINLSYIYIPNNVKMIAINAFSGCTNALTIATEENSYAKSYAKAHHINYVVISTPSSMLAEESADSIESLINEEQIVLNGTVTKLELNKLVNDIMFDAVYSGKTLNLYVQFTEIKTSKTILSEVNASSRTFSYPKQNGTYDINLYISENAYYDSCITKIGVLVISDNDENENFANYDDFYEDNANTDFEQVIAFSPNQIEQIAKSTVNDYEKNVVESLKHEKAKDFLDETKYGFIVDTASVTLLKHRLEDKKGFVYDIGLFAFREKDNKKHYLSESELIDLVKDNKLSIKSTKSADGSSIISMEQIYNGNIRIRGTDLGKTAITFKLGSAISVVTINVIKTGEYKVEPSNKVMYTDVIF